MTTDKNYRIGRNTEQYWLHLQFSEPIVRYKINEIIAGAVLPEIDMNQYSLFFDLMLISVLAGGVEEKKRRCFLNGQR